MECTKTCAMKLKSVSGSRYRQIGIFEQFVLSLNVCIDAKKKKTTHDKKRAYILQVIVHKIAKERKSRQTYELRACLFIISKLRAQTLQLLSNKFERTHSSEL